MNNTEIVDLDSDLRLVYTHSQGRNSAHFGIIVRAGTRDESEKEHGMAHFLEHMLFKGTHKRKPFHILNRMESIGGELNAYTTKEFTCVYTSFLEPYLNRAIDLLSDIVFRAQFPIQEIEKERNVILDEIASYQDDYHESIYDEFEQHIFKGHPLGHLILGTEDHVRSFDRDMIQNFYFRNYSANRIVLSYVGPSSLNKVIKAAKSLAFGARASEKAQKEVKFNNYRAFSATKTQSSYQAYCCIGNATYGIDNDKRFSLSLLNNLLCGDNMNSRLNLLIREKRGWAYAITSEYIPYSEVGAFSIQFSCEAKRLESVLKLVEKELNFLSTKELSKTILLRAKKQLINRLSMAMDSSVSVMLANGKSVLDHGSLKPAGEIVRRINDISSADLKAIARENFDPANISKLIYLPENA